jgi:hypothetical protein
VRIGLIAVLIAVAAFLALADQDAPAQPTSANAALELAVLARARVKGRVVTFARVSVTGRPAVVVG